MGASKNSLLVEHVLVSEIHSDSLNLIYSPKSMAINKTTNCVLRKEHTIENFFKNNSQGIIET